MFDLTNRLSIKYTDKTTLPGGFPLIDESIRRRELGERCSAAGIALNTLLFAGKLAAGLISGSVAVTADAFNNLSDAGSAIVTLLGFRLGSRRPDAEHPYGHARMEYVSALLVAVMILVMAVELIRSAVEQLIRPAPLTVSALTLAILAVSMAVKLGMFALFRRIGRKIDSESLLAAATDALSDCAATGTVLLCTLLYRFRGIHADGFGGLAVGGFVLLAGLRSLSDTVNTILGRKPDDTLVESIRALTVNHPEILGVHDIVLHDYGPGRLMASLHAEVSADGDLMALHSAVEHIEDELEATIGCRTVIHMDPVRPDDGQLSELRRILGGILYGIDPRLGIHDLRVGEYEGEVLFSFDVEAPYSLDLTDEDLRQRINCAVHMIHPCRLTVRVDRKE